MAPLADLGIVAGGDLAAARFLVVAFAVVVFAVAGLLVAALAIAMDGEEGRCGCAIERS